MWQSIIWWSASQLQTQSSWLSELVTPHVSSLRCDISSGNTRFCYGMSNKDATLQACYTPTYAAQ